MAGAGKREANTASKEVGGDARVMRTYTAPGSDKGQKSAGIAV